MKPRPMRGPWRSSKVVLYFLFTSWLALTWARSDPGAAVECRSRTDDARTATRAPNSVAASHKADLPALTTSIGGSASPGTSDHNKEPPSEQHVAQGQAQASEASRVEEPRDVIDEAKEVSPVTEAGATTGEPAPATTEKIPQQQQQQQQQPPPPPTTQPPPTTPEPECNAVCLNDGKCVRLPSGEEICICPPGFSGNRCQVRDICKTVIADSLTGDEICARLGSTCLTDDKLFRCKCGDDEFFVFKADYYRLKAGAEPAIDIGPNGAAGASRTPSAIKEATSASGGGAGRPTNNLRSHNSFAYDSSLPLGPAGGQPSPGEQRATPGGAGAGLRKAFFLAECRKIDRCLGVRCRQMSERCVEGECQCNQAQGYIRDPRDQLCKLLDPCKMPTPDGQPICGQAKCVATYDQELFRCVCPIGYNNVQVGGKRSSTKCGLPYDTICNIPLLNKCQHLCRVDQKTYAYKCSCLPGYSSGTRAGLDDHLCFFDEYPNSAAGSRGGGGGDNSASSPWDQRHTSPGRSANETIPYDTGVPSTRAAAAAAQPEPQARVLFRATLTLPPQPPQPADRDREAADSFNPLSRPKREIVIRRELAAPPEPGRLGQLPVGQAIGGRSGGASGQYEADELAQTSAQDRCNMYCEENKICVLEEGSADSYRCVCDRQGFVSVGDKCLDWCAAAEFSHGVQSLVEGVCYSGLCRRRPEVLRPPSDLSSSFYAGRKFTALPEAEQRRLKLEAGTSWRPAFECDCTTSPVMFKDPESHLCQLDFEAILRPCLPGNEGHTDCVVNKHAYCAVLHWPAKEFYQELRSSRLAPESQAFKAAAAGQMSLGASARAFPLVGSASEAQYNKQPMAQLSAVAAAAAAAAKKLKAKEKSYTCVCSPEKKFLVDKPRNKARCIDECDLLHNECGRHNRMCRAPSVDLNEHFGSANLIRSDRGEVRMNQFKRTGCECLPGFNVGPKEPRDFTLDDNNSLDAGHHEETLTPPPPFGTAGAGLSRAPGFGASVIAPMGPLNTLELSTLENANGGNLIEGDQFTVDHLRGAKYMNINSRCLLDYDVVEFHARFKAPADFEPAWVRVRTDGKPGDPPTGPPSSGEPPADSSPATATTGDKVDEKGPDVSAPGASVGHHKSQPGRPEASARGALAEDRPASASAGSYEESLLQMPSFMRANIEDFYKHVVLVAQCDYSMAQLSLGAYESCIRYRYWVVQKLRTHFADWRQVMSNSLRETFELMDGNIRFRVNKCEATIKRVTTIPRSYFEPAAGKRPGESGVAPLNSTGNKVAPPSRGGAELGRSPSRMESVPPSASSTRPTGGGNPEQQPATQMPEEVLAPGGFDPLDQYARVDADVDCELTIHSASDDDSAARRHVRKVLLEKQLPRFIFSEPRPAIWPGQGSWRKPGLPDGPTIVTADTAAGSKPASQQLGAGPPPHTTGAPETSLYYLMAPKALIARESFDHLATHRKLFSPCRSDYAYCDKQTRCEMIDSVNYTCTCQAGYTPIGSRDIYLGDSRKEVCEDIDECLFDVCKLNGLENKSVCVNEIGDYRCQCIRHHVGDNKRYCNHICNVIACKHGDCRIPDEHHAFCECHEGYREPDCSVQDPSVALRKANMIICASIFASVLLLAITLAISLNSQLKKTKKKLKRLEAAHEAVEFYEFSLQQPPYRQRVSKASTGS